MRKVDIETSTETRIDELEREIKRRFDVFNVQVINRLGDFVTADGLDLVSIQNGYRREIQNFAAEMANVFLLGTQISAADASRQLGNPVVYDPADPQALLALANLRSRVMDGLLQQQREALQEIQRIAAQITPIRNVQQIRQGLNLTGPQIRAVANYRRLLEENSLEALQRELRDRRFDSTVRRAARTGEPLTVDQIDRMVERYQSRQLDFRARTIAATEAVRIANQSDESFYSQLISREQLDPTRVTRTWITSEDGKVRDSHRSLSQVQRPFGQPWVTSSGATLQFPGDQSAPLSETINCRCWVKTELDVNQNESEIAA